MLNEKENDYLSTKCSVDEISCRRNAFQQKCHSTKDIGFINLFVAVQTTVDQDTPINLPSTSTANRPSALTTKPPSALTTKPPSTSTTSLPSTSTTSHVVSCVCPCCFGFRCKGTVSHSFSDPTCTITACRHKCKMFHERHCGFPFMSKHAYCTAVKS